MCHLHQRVRYTFIPDAALSSGVYDIRAVATDTYGAQSEPSATIRVAVTEPGYIRIGSLIIGALSVIVPLIALTLLLIFGTWYLWHRLRVWRGKVIKETREAENKLRTEFDEIITNLHSNVAALKDSRKGKLTKAENALIEDIETDLKNAQEHISKEISDIDDVVQ